MTFRTRLFVSFMFALLLAVALIAAGVTVVSRRAFDELNREHSDALLAQFQKEFQRRGKDVVDRVKGIADAEPTVRMAIDLSRTNADVSVYVNDANGVSRSHQLDILDFVSNDGTIISSAESPARFNYKMQWVTKPEDWAARGAFLMKLDTEAGPTLALLSVATVRVGDRDLYVVGGERLAKEFLASLVLPPNMRALLYLNLDPQFQETNLVDANGPAPDANRFQPLVDSETSNPVPQTAKIDWSIDPASAEMFHALPLLGRSNDLLGVLFVGTSQRTVVTLERRIRWLALGVIAVGLLIGLMLSWWGAARVTRPVQKLAEGAHEVAEGNWSARVDVRGHDEVSQLAKSFNQMTEQLVEQRERLVQAERVAAWREVARRLAHELKNPLFPLQTTVENLQKAREQQNGQFDEVFRESTGILITEIENLKAIVGRFSDFAKMPQPELGAVNLNDIVRNVVKLFEGQFSAVGRPADHSRTASRGRFAHRFRRTPRYSIAPWKISCSTPWTRCLPAASSCCAPSTSSTEVSLEVSDTGSGLTPEETERLFTPYYTTKQHGTGLGLAIVQAVIADHGGRISVESETGVGTSFHIELPIKPPHKPQVFPMVFEKKEDEA